MARLRCTFAAFVLLVIGFTCSAQSTYPPVIKKVLVNDKVNPVAVTQLNSDLTLSCQFDAANATVTWRLNSRTFTPPTTITASTDIPNGVATLTIPQATWPGLYTGTYECIVANSQGTAVSSPALVVAGAFTGKDLKPGGSQQTTNMPFAPGTLVVLTCNSSGPITYSPTIWSLFPVFVWFGITTVLNPLKGTFGRVELENSLSPRYSTNEVGTLYIRSATAADFNAYSALECRINQNQFTLELPAGRYMMSTSPVPGSPANSLQLIYKTPDVTVAEGTNVTLSCIFDGPNFAAQPIVWNNKFSESIDNAAKILIYTVTPDLPRTWTCTYTDATGASNTGTINVNVNSYPEISGLEDAYATTGSTATFTCIVRGPTLPLTITWFKNEAEITPMTVKFNTNRVGNFTSVLTVNKVDKTDIGAFSCVATNVVATRRLGVRLIVTEPAVVTLAAIMDTPVSGSSGDFPVSKNTTEIRFVCNYTLDRDILLSTVTVAWQMQQYTGDITADTVAPEFGISQSVATYPNKHQSFLTLQYYPESFEKILGTVNCTVIYKILGKTFRASSDTSGSIYSPVPPSKITIVAAAQFPYWIIGVIVAALFLILLVFLIIFCVQRNKGEQYYVDEKERKAGHDPKEELPPWQDFNRPDQDPVKGSRASLEMEGERPMGSDTGSMDEYGVDTDTGKFNEDGSFIGQYGPKGKQSGATGHV